MSAWRLVSRAEEPVFERWLRRREPLAVNFSAAWLQRRRRGPEAQSLDVWVSGPAPAYSAVVGIRGRQMFWPLLGAGDPPPWTSPGYPQFFTLMGPTESVDWLASWIPRPVYNGVDYDFLCRPAAPPNPPLSLELPGLNLRRASPRDLDALYPLQAAYEQEEVLMDPADFNAYQTRFLLQRTLKQEAVFLAEAGGEPIAKGNTNAQGWAWVQIGGVYTCPNWRRRGAARALMARMAADWAAQDRGLALFVKKPNRPAQELYRRLGFEEAGPFRILYYQP